MTWNLVLLVFWIYLGNYTCAVGNKKCHRLNSVSHKWCHRLNPVSKKRFCLKTACQQLHLHSSRYALFQTLYFDFSLFLAYFLMKMKCIFEKKCSLTAMNCIFCSHFDCYIPSAFKESLCFLCWILHYFLSLKPLALFCRYYSLELEIYISFS